MHTQVLANNDVHLRFDPIEHLAVSQSLFFLISSMDERRIPLATGMDAERAYEFVYGVYLAEAAARSLGIDWLPSYGIMATAPALSDIPMAAISFTEEGSDWRLSISELRLVQSVASEVAHRAAS